MWEDRLSASSVYWQRGLGAVDALGGAYDPACGRGDRAGGLMTVTIATVHDALGSGANETPRVVVQGRIVVGLYEMPDRGQADRRNAVASDTAGVSGHDEGLWCLILLCEPCRRLSN